MRKFCLTAAIFAFLPLWANAAEQDPLDPVRRIVAIAEENSRLTPDGNVMPKDYLAGDTLKENFSAAFVKAVEEGSKRSAEAGDIFIDYDPVSGSQDSCPLKDVALSNEGEREGAFDVVMHFRSIYCFGDEFADEVDETRFRVVMENERAVIDDIINVFSDIDSISLRQVMADYFQE